LMSDAGCWIVDLFNHSLDLPGAFFFRTLGKELYVHSTVFRHTIVALTCVHRVPRSHPFISSLCVELLMLCQRTTWSKLKTPQIFVNCTVFLQNYCCPHLGAIECQEDARLYHLCVELEDLEYQNTAHAFTKRPHWSSRSQNLG
jgi:hypothetical protein